MISNEKYNQYLNFVERNEDLDKNLLEDFRKGGFIIDDNFDELKYIRHRMNGARYSERELALTIAPTSDCNFRCVYCYEKDSIRKKTMTVETQKKLLIFIKEKMTKVDSLSITWYGGEPLLAMDIIDKLSKEIISICNDKKIDYTSSMITNGYLLNKKNIEKIQRNKIEFLQITLDGDKETHDRRRFLEGGVGTFDVIMSNLVKYKESLPYISLRINVDKNNSKKVMSLLREIQLYKLNDKVFPYLGHVRDINDCYTSGDCLMTREFSELQLDLNKKINMPIELFYPNNMANACGADSIQGYVIDADGLLYKCWDDIGHVSRNVGSIEDVELTSTYLDYLSHDPTLKKDCMECKYLPICLGGCPHLFGKTESCVADKYILEEKLNYFVKQTLLQSNE